ncbi:MAG: IreB family regulatory phosphoprotein [bacterium]|nr:IreB family regulatory phosphoprotein [Mycoplasmatota bacterium]MDD6757638.1 IreB family regulatory phosphoprotein [bacterium]MDY2908676.1 IreB family regulatory phosphoprotein [Candidatus Faecimonas sp.]
MPQDKTSLFNVKDIDNRFISDILEEVWGSLEERGYNPSNQIVGYLISGDPGYISSYQDARNKIQQIDRAKIIEVLLQEFYKNHQ